MTRVTFRKTDDIDVAAGARLAPRGGAVQDDDSSLEAMNQLALELALLDHLGQACALEQAELHPDHHGFYFARGSEAFVDDSKVAAHGVDAQI